MNAGLALLRRAFRLAKKSRKIGEVPEFELFPLDNARKGFFERVDFERLMLELPDYLRPAFHAAYLTGWRVQSELLTRRRADVDLEKGWLYLEAGVSKNGKPRQFPLDALPELRSVIAAQLERTRAPELETGQVIPWLFHKAGQPIKNFRHAWRAACKRAEVPDAIPHDFRRAAVRNLERAGGHGARGLHSLDMRRRLCISDMLSRMKKCSKKLLPSSQHFTDLIREQSAQRSFPFRRRRVLTSNLLIASGILNAKR